jgi:hypothetical protein
MANLLPVVEASVLPAYALAWHRALASIPTDRLDEYYLRAFGRKETGKPVTATDIMAEWNRLRELRELDEDLKPEYRGRY